MIASLFSLALVALLLIGNWKIYTKAGKPGWAAIVPIYNIIVLLELTGKPIWWIAMFLIPGVNVVFMIMMYHALSLSFGKSAGFTVGILFLPFIFIPLLGLGDAQYIGPAGEGCKVDENNAVA